MTEGLRAKAPAPPPMNLALPRAWPLATAFWTRKLEDTSASSLGQFHCFLFCLIGAAVRALYTAMKPQIQAKVLHITIIILLLLGIVFLSVGYNIAESQGMTTCALKVPGFIELMETYGFKYVNVRICFEGAAEHPRANDTFAGMCNPGKNFAWYVYFVSSFQPGTGRIYCFNMSCNDLDAAGTSTWRRRTSSQRT